MRLSDVTAVVRSLDMNYATNRAVVVFGLAVTAGGALARLSAGAGLMHSASWGVSAGLTVSLAWVLGRELDPDHDLSAFVASGLTLVGLWLLDAPDLLPLLWMVFLLRILNRTTGLPARILDTLLMLGFGSWLSWQDNWIYGLMTALAFVLDSRLSPPRRRHLFFAGIALLVTLILHGIRGRAPVEGEPSLPAILAALGMSVLFVPVIVGSRQLSAVGDATGEPLNPRRVQAAQVMALLIGLQIAWWDGDRGMVQLMPAWAALLGLALYNLFGTVYAYILSYTQR